MKGSLIIVGFFVLGIIVGVWDVIPASFLASDVSYYALCCLMFCVGISIGCDTSILKSFRKVNPRLMMLPVMTILGTLAGCAAASLILGHRQISDCLAIGSGFGFRIDPFNGRTALHTGLDFAAPVGTPIRAAAGGRVIEAQHDGAYGLALKIDHGQGLVTRYAHSSEILVRPGELVRRGQTVARVGSTGRSTGPHLHFEVLLEGVQQDPARFLALGERLDADLPPRPGEVLPGSGRVAKGR
mgnify:CR=1 FL=1